MRVPSGVAAPDVIIAGAGIIGLSLALELRRRGASILVLEQGKVASGASDAAAGMLAAEDPHNPPKLLQLSRYSLALYPEFLERVESFAGHTVPFQTSSTIQYTASGTRCLSEHSIDPRQLNRALLTAVRAVGVAVAQHTPVMSLDFNSPPTVLVQTPHARYQAGQFVHASGAWTLSQRTGGPVTPRKGQMLRVAMPPGSPLQAIHRAEHVYVVPRTSGPQAGSALVGATVEDAGFDLIVHPAQLQHLRAAAAALSPETAFVAEAPMIEAWAGIRPHTPDQLPLIGRLREREWITAGHFRNGILLAPGTAAVLASLIAGEEPEVDLTPFAPQRFAALR